MTHTENHAVEHLTDDVHREHEIVIMQCQDCHQFIVDARSDNNDGEMLGGWFSEDLTWCIIQAVNAIDKHEFDKALLINVPF